jgi:acetolactate synthase-1/2/3 large subunit
MGKIKVSDLVANFIANHKDTADKVFMVSGGGNMHLIDSLGRNPDLEYICNHHEQACTFAAEGYARVTNKIGVSYVTTGPGGTNAITGVYSAWVDSIPTLTISGQVKFETTIASQPELQLRQLGDQEVNIIDLVTPVTKYAVMVTDKNLIKYHLQKAVYEAKFGRPGPVWLDIPLDIQGAYVNEEELVAFTPEQEPVYDTKIDEVVALLQKAERPVIIAGNGITLSGANKLFLEFLDQCQIPVVGTFARYDIVHDDHPCAFGRYGTIGHRATNFIVQNSDLVLAIGARMNIRSISYNWEYFAREAIKIAVDIDSAELNKHTLQLDMKIQSDAKQFISNLLEKIKSIPSYKPWIQRCQQYKKMFPTITAEKINEKSYVNSYYFFDTLSSLAKNDTVFVFGNATASISSFQSLKTKGTQRIIENSGCAAMGYDLPASIGACMGNQQKEVICVTGEGSLQMNIQELQTIIHYKLPIKIFILNNQGYASIKHTQNNFFNGFKVGSDINSGVSFPDIQKIAKAYGFQAYQIKNQKDLHNDLKEVLAYPDTLICEILLNPTEKMEPKLSSEIKKDGTIVSKPLEDMFPFLPRNIFFDNMIIDLIDKKDY